MWLNYIILLLFVFGVNGAKLTKDDSCDMPNESEWLNKDLLFDVRDVDIDSVKEYNISNIIGLDMDPETYVTYSFEKENSILRFSLTKDFEKFVEKEDSNRYEIKLSFKCKNDQTVQAYLNLLVDTTKNYAPQFLNTPYKFKLILPIFANKIIEGVDVKALDLNIGNEMLVFTVTGECSTYFEFTETTKSFKTYSTNLKSKKLIQLDQSLTCDIEVHDKIDNDKTKMILEVDTQNSQPPNPIFEKPLYEAKLSDDNVLEHEDIKLIKTEYTPKFDIDTEYKDYFQFENNKLSLLKPLPGDVFEKKKYLAVTIKATYKNAQFPGKTVVLITSSKENGKDEIPVFEEPLYLAQYVDSNTIKHNDIKLKTPNTDVTFNIISDYKEYFAFENNKLVLTKSLPESEFDNKNFISITIEAKDKESSLTAKTVVIVEPTKSLNVPNPVFEQPLYVVKYTDPNTIEQPAIKLESAIYKATFQIISDYKEYFAFENDKLVLTKSLPESEFDNKNFISVTIEAKYEESLLKGKTVVIIEPTKSLNMPNPVFEQPLYVVKYTDPNTIEQPAIKLESAIYKATFQIISDYKEYFAFENDKLVLTKSLSESEFDNKNFISVTIEAKYEESLLKGKTVVIIEPTKSLNMPNPVFEQPLYVVKYTDSNTIEQPTIKLESTKYKATFQIISDYKEYFAFENDKLVLTKLLPESEFDNKNFISVTIEAKYEESLLKGKTVVIIEPTKSLNIPNPVFEQPLYVVKYTDSNTIEQPAIKLESAKYKATFQIISDYKEYFAFENDKLVLTKSLPESEFDNKNFISVTIEAKYEESLLKGKTVVIIEPTKSLNIPKPVFEQPLYVVKYTDPDTIEQPVIKLESTKYKATFQIISDYKQYFAFENNKLLLTKQLPESEFDNKNYISVTIEAKYEESLLTGKTVVIIEPANKKNVQNLNFEQPLYIAKYIDENTIDHSDIKLISTEIKATFKIDSDYKEYFKFENNKLKLIKALSEEEFLNKTFIYVIIEASYEESLGKTIVLINAPKKNNTLIPVFEQPIYLAKYIDQNTLQHSDIKLKLESNQATFEIYSDYKSYLEFKNNKLVLKKPLPIEEFNNKNFILVTIEARYEGSLNIGKTIVLIETPLKPGLSSTLKYSERVVVYDKDPGFIGKIGTFTAKSQSDEKISYSIKKSDISATLSYNQFGELYAIENIPDGSSYQITLQAKGEKSGDEDTMDIVLIIKNRLNGKSEFEYSLIVESRDEKIDPSIIVSGSTSHCIEILDKQSEEWFYIDQCNLVLRTINREDPRLRDMFISQVKTIIQAVPKTKTKFSNNTRIKKSFYSELPGVQEQNSCIDISTIPSAKDVMNVVVIIRDINDHAPKFEEELLIIGYPSAKLSEFIAPPYLVQVKATDEDTGLNAKIKYRVNNNFKIDSEHGIIFPANYLLRDTEFIVFATDQDGEGYSTPLTVKVKILEQEDITILTLKNISYMAIDEFVLNLSNKTKKTVKYLTSAALPNSIDFIETKKSQVYSSDDTINVLRMMMYALDDNGEVVKSSDFKKLIESADLQVDIEVEKYELPNDDKDSDEDETDNVGWIAAVSTLSTLLILVIIGVILAYFFFVRPRMYEANVGYLKHKTRDSIHITPVETKIESSTADRRPTGFPIGFTPSELDEDDDEENEIKNDSELTEDENVEDKTDSDDSKTDQERKKSVVTFDVNVTEIEIEEF